jgi:hypothetical protein
MRVGSIVLAVRYDELFTRGGTPTDYIVVAAVDIEHRTFSIRGLYSALQRTLWPRYAYYFVYSSVCIVGFDSRQMQGVSVLHVAQTLCRVHTASCTMGAEDKAA